MDNIDIFIYVILEHRTQRFLFLYWSVVLLSRSWPNSLCARINNPVTLIDEPLISQQQQQQQQKSDIDIQPGLIAILCLKFVSMKTAVFNSKHVINSKVTWPCSIAWPYKRTLWNNVNLKKKQTIGFDSTLDDVVWKPLNYFSIRVRATKLV